MCLSLFLMFACGPDDKDYVWESVEVTVSAYNSVRHQTSGNPQVAAWGDTLVPGEKSIAVSADLVKKGLGHMTKVKIEGVPGIFVVKDKMHSRWKNRIDIYMGTDVEKAKAWGKKIKTIQYTVLKSKANENSN